MLGDIRDRQQSILQQAARHPDRLVVSPAHLPPGPRVSIARALLNAGMVARAEPSDGSASWKLDGEANWLSITDVGRQAIGQPDKDPVPAAGVASATAAEAAAAAAADDTTSPAKPPVAPPASKHRPKLRDAAMALLIRWDDTIERKQLADAVAALRTALDAAPRHPGTTRAPRLGTKQELVLVLLRRHDGATIANVIEATGWAQHTVRGFFAGLKTKGHTIEVLDRVRQNGPGNAGAKGSYSVYRLAEAG